MRVLARIETLVVVLIALAAAHSISRLVARSGAQPSTPGNARRLAASPPSAAPSNDQAARPALRDTRETSTIEAPCQMDHLTKQLQSDRVRIVGKYCGKRTPASKPSSMWTVSIQNLTTGYSATVFKDDREQRFSSDYIPLVTGENRILIDYFTGNNPKASDSGTLRVIKN